MDSQKRQRLEGYEDVSKIEDFSKIEDLSKPITIDRDDMNTGIFWDVVDYPFIAGTDPDAIYEQIQSTLDSELKDGLLSIWAYVDGTDSSWNQYLGNKTWKSRLYFISSVKDKDERAHRIFIDISLWKLDVLPAPEARLFVILDQVHSVNHFFYPMLHRLVSLGIKTTLYAMPFKDHQPDKLHWTQLCGDYWVNCEPPPIPDLPCILSPLSDACDPPAVPDLPCVLPSPPLSDV